MTKKLNLYAQEGMTLLLRVSFYELFKSIICIWRKKMKKMTSVIVFALIISVIFIYFDYQLSQRWLGNSKDNKWKIVYKDDKDNHADTENTYHGILYYAVNENKNSVKIIAYSFKRNDKHVCGWNMEDKPKEFSLPFEFVCFSGKPRQNDKYILELEWKEDEVLYKEKIKMKPLFK